MSDDRVRVVLTCHHTMEFAVSAPMLGDELWCYRCQHMRAVAEAPVEYRIRCRKCPYGKRLGSERLNAEVKASRHHVKTGHVVALYNGRELVYEVGATFTRERAGSGVAGKYASTETPMSDPPPF